MVLTVLRRGFEKILGGVKINESGVLKWNLRVLFTLSACMQLLVFMLHTASASSHAGVTGRKQGPLQ